MSRSRKRNWYGYWPWSRYLNLFFCRILKERCISQRDWNSVLQADNKSLPDKLFFGKVYSEYKTNYKWVKKYENRRYRLAQKRRLKKDFEEYVEDVVVKDIDFYHGD